MIIGGLAFIGSVITYKLSKDYYYTDNNPFDDFKKKLRFSRQPKKVKTKDDYYEGTFYSDNSIGYWFSDWYDIEVKVIGTQEEWDDFLSIPIKLSFGFERIGKSFSTIIVNGYYKYSMHMGTLKPHVLYSCAKSINK